MPGMVRRSGGDLMVWIRQNGQPVECSLWNADEETDAAAILAEQPGSRKPRPGMFDAMFSRLRPGRMLTLYDLTPTR